LALLYRIYPDAHWLFAVQAAALALAAWPVWALARMAGLEKKGAATMALAFSFFYARYGPSFDMPGGSTPGGRRVRQLPSFRLEAAS
jgi:uncharacterized membrane protein